MEKYSDIGVAKTGSQELDYTLDLEEWILRYRKLAKGTLEEKLIGEVRRRLKIEAQATEEEIRMAVKKGIRSTRGIMEGLKKGLVEDAFDKMEDRYDLDHRRAVSKLLAKLGDGTYLVGFTMPQILGMANSVDYGFKGTVNAIVDPELKAGYERVVCQAPVRAGYSIKMASTVPRGAKCIVGDFINTVEYGKGYDIDDDAFESALMAECYGLIPYHDSVGDGIRSLYMPCGSGTANDYCAYADGTVTLRDRSRISRFMPNSVQEPSTVFDNFTSWKLVTSIPAVISSPSLATANLPTALKDIEEVVVSGNTLEVVELRNTDSAYYVVPGDSFVCHLQTNGFTGKISMQGGESTVHSDVSVNKGSFLCHTKNVDGTGLTLIASLEEGGLSREPIAYAFGMGLCQKYTLHSIVVRSYYDTILERTRRGKWRAWKYGHFCGEDPGKKNPDELEFICTKVKDFDKKVKVGRLFRALGGLSVESWLLTDRVTPNHSHELVKYMMRQRHKWPADLLEPNVIASLVHADVADLKAAVRYLLYGIRPGLGTIEEFWNRFLATNARGGLELDVKVPIVYADVERLIDRLTAAMHIPTDSAEDDNEGLYLKIFLQEFLAKRSWTQCSMEVIGMIVRFLDSRSNHNAYLEDRMIKWIHHQDLRITERQKYKPPDNAILF